MRRVGVSGLGSIGRQHATALASVGSVETLGFDPSDELRHAARQSGTVAQTFDDFEDLLDARPDALIIAAPDFAHLPQLEAATERGIPCLVEKPLADSLEAARAAVPRVEATGTPALVGYVLRHRAVVATTRELVRTGQIGTPTSFQVMLGAYGTITAAASRFAVPEADRLYRDYSHEWDYVRWIFGPISEVLGVARTVHDVPHVESPNVVDGLLATRSGVVGAFHIDYVEPRGTRTLHIVGTGGSIVADFGLGTVVVRRAGEDHDRLIQQVEPAAGPLARQARHLLAVTAGEEEPRVTLRDGLSALEVTAALIRSAEQRSWVAVPKDPA